jgi:hypothetical protein
MTQIVERTRLAVTVPAYWDGLYAPTKPSGPAAAAILAAGIGCFVMGLVTSIAAGVSGFSNAIAFVNPVGPLSGKSDIAIATYLVAWLVLYLVWRKKDINIGRVGTATLILVALGILGTFPTFFDVFVG